jgi:hypothetical protein
MLAPLPPPPPFPSHPPPPSLPPQLYPYHLAPCVDRLLRISPFKYYSDTLFQALKEELSYDRLPNFMVGGCFLGEVGGGEAGWEGKGRGGGGAPEQCVLVWAT